MANTHTRLITRFKIGGLRPSDASDKSMILMPVGCNSHRNRALSSHDETLVVVARSLSGEAKVYRYETQIV